MGAQSYLARQLKAVVPEAVDANRMRAVACRVVVLEVADANRMLVESRGARSKARTGEEACQQVRSTEQRASRQPAREHSTAHELQ